MQDGKTWRSVLDGFFGTFTQVISDDIGIKGCDSI